MGVHEGEVGESLDGLLLVEVLWAGLHPVGDELDQFYRRVGLGGGYPWQRGICRDKKKINLPLENGGGTIYNGICLYVNPVC